METLAGSRAANLKPPESIVISTSSTIPLRVSTIVDGTLISAKAIETNGEIVA
jgi:hypothetical protein